MELGLDISMYGVFYRANRFCNYYWTEDRSINLNNTEIIWVAQPVATNTSKFITAPISFIEIIKYYAVN